VCSEELSIQKAIEEQLRKAKISFQMVPIWGSTLYNKADLPYDPKSQLPHIYGKFREKSAGTPVQSLIPPMEEGDLPLPKNWSDEVNFETCSKFMPSLKDFGFTSDEIELM